MTKFSIWLDEQFGWNSIRDTIFLRKIPKVNWFFTLGSATLFVALNQGITGILMSLYYVPTPDHAWDSVNYITNVVSYGWLIRGMHHWGASIMVVLVMLHMLRVFFMGAYKYPREITWITGMVLGLVTLGFGFTGYLLTWDQKAYWATTVGTSLAGVVPGVGTFLMKVLRGGEEISAVTLARFFGVHVWVLPALLILLIGVHLYLIIRHGISAQPKRSE